jgi:hypothetical protein
MNMKTTDFAEKWENPAMMISTKLLSGSTKWLLNIHISDPTIQEAALQFAKEYEVKDFHASSGWLDNVRKRNLFSQRTLCGNQMKCHKMY